MNILIVPDIHLKTKIFDMADKIDKSKYDSIVVLGDLVDDWNQGSNLKLYEKTLDRACQFAQEHPTSLWCWGNHDISYFYDLPQSGYSIKARKTAYEGLNKLNDILKDRVNIIWRIDDCLFSHAGLTKTLADRVTLETGSDQLTDIMNTINNFVYDDYDAKHYLWEMYSPIWMRPDFDFPIYHKCPADMYGNPETELLNVTGHTPVVKPWLYNNTLTMDNFSTYPNSLPIGDEKLYILDTIEHIWYPA